MQCGEQYRKKSHMCNNGEWNFSISLKKVMISKTYSYWQIECNDDAYCYPYLIAILTLWLCFNKHLCMEVRIERLKFIEASSRVESRLTTSFLNFWEWRVMVFLNYA